MATPKHCRNCGDLLDRDSILGRCSKCLESRKVAEYRNALFQPRKEVKNPLADIRETADGLRPSKPRVYVRINTSNMGQRPSFQRDPMTGTWDLNMRPRGPVGATIVLGDEVVEMISRSWLAHKAQQTAIEENT